MLNPQNLTLVERAKYFPDTLDRETLIDALVELEAWRNAIYKQTSCDTPEEACDYMESLEQNQANPDYADRPDLKEFFDDIVSHWEDTLANGPWSCPEAYDQNLRSAIMDDMTRGSDALELIRKHLDGDDVSDEMRDLMERGQ